MGDALTGVCILAGGLASRMGREKAAMRLGRRTLLGHVRRAAQSLGVDVRVIREDLVPRCGPLGGIYTGLKTSAHQAELFLACDMPFVSLELLRTVMAMEPPVFVQYEGRVGFPAKLSPADLEIIKNEIQAGRFSLQNLAERLKAGRLRLRRKEGRQLLNVNTPTDWQEAQRRRAELPCK